ncbi:uncharacterized protein N7484_009881 [Penicillium longicatenatum]|uniref:uncharacterized protein n=1 Tax=Penicillium longicatenatum TaxID=1561947 RepID=UPI0025480F8D|nr:uncharacterized protein N7484_009881 [Penicillium longicatenatum]KAJ5636568.1 hypothetical protein N7484_009881 [Penicillium longicatenatum]
METQVPTPRNPEDPTYPSSLGFEKEVTSDSSPRHSTNDSPRKSLATVEDVNDDEGKYLTGIKLSLVIASVTLVTFLVLLDMSIIVTAIPTITTQFHSLGDVGWYGSAYQIASACLQPLTGKLYTNFNSKWTFLAFFFVFELGSLLCGIANSSKMLIVARAVAGMGCSGLMNGTLTIISSCVPLHKSPKIIGMVMGFCQTGLICGPLIGGAFTEKASWRWCFYINLPIGAVVAIALAFINIPEQFPKPSIKSAAKTILHKLDLIGFILFSPAAIQLLLALEYGAGSYPWGSARVIGLFCGSGGAFIVFLLWEHRQGDKAMIPLSMVAQRTVWTSCVFMMGLFGTVLALSYYLPIYFQSVRNDTPIMSGVSLLPMMLSQVVFAVSSGILIGRLGYYLPWAVFCGALTAISGGLLATLSPHTSVGKWVGYEIIAGAGRGTGFQMPIIAIQNALHPTQLSVGMAVLMFTQTLSGAVFLTLANVIFDAGLKSLLPKDAPNADAAAIIAAGATGFRSAVSSEDLPGVLTAYAKSIDYVFYATAGLGVVMFLIAFGMGWKDVRKKKTSPESA